MLEPKVKAAELRELYASNPAVDKMHALIIGAKGSGKTSLIKTVPKPALVMSFDPGGTTVLREEIEKGDILVDTSFENDSPDDPKAFLQYQKRYLELEKAQMFNAIGTFVIDSITTMTNSVIWQILKKEGRILPPMDTKIKISGQKEGEVGQGMRRIDWNTLLNVMQMITRTLATLPCHTIMLGHIGEDIDEVTKQKILSILVPGKSKDYIPILLPEFYAISTYNTAKGVVRQLQTQTTSSFHCTSRMSLGKLDPTEPLDIKALLKKAGMNWEDKEPL